VTGRDVAFGREKSPFEGKNHPGRPRRGSHQRGKPAPPKRDIPRGLRFIGAPSRRRKIRKGGGFPNGTVLGGGKRRNQRRVANPKRREPVN